MITSRSNEKVKFACSLREKKNRDQTGLFLIENDKLVKEAIDNNLKIKYLFYTENKNKYALYDNSFEVRKDVFEKLSDTKTPQGIIGIFEKPRYNEEILSTDKRILYLDKVQNSDNVGALIRSSDAGGFDKVILNEGCADPFSDKAVRSSAGSVFNIPIITDKNLSKLERLNKSGYKIIAGDLNGSEEFNFDNERCVLVIGNEGNGISENVKKLCTDFVKIPVYGKAQSLNASVSGGILIYKIIGY